MSAPTAHARVPVWIYEGIDQLAERQGVSQAEIVRQALHWYLAEKSIVAPGLRADR